MFLKKPSQCHAILIVLEVGLDQLNYSVSEESGSVQICVVALPGAPTFGDNTVQGVQIDIATSVDTAEGNDFAPNYLR